MATIPTVVIHGGAGSRKLNPERHQRIRESLHFILTDCQKLLRDGASAMEIVTRAAVLLEDDSLYNAGRGSKIQSDGRIRMSASLMDGHQRRFGGCINVEGVRNPILLARALMNEKDRVLSGAGAKRFAREIGLKFRSPYTPQAIEAYKARIEGRGGTIGAVAVDQKGRLAAATSTGGRGFEYPFRVSDSPTAAGNFATPKAAVSATGTGEEIVENGVATTVCALVEVGWSLERAVNHVLKKARKAGGDFGLIAIDSRGRVVAKTNTPLLIWGHADSKQLSAMGKIL